MGHAARRSTEASGSLAAILQARGAAGRGRVRRPRHQVGKSLQVTRHRCAAWEPDVEVAYQRGGWREAAKLLYREYLVEEGLDPRDLRGKDLVCTCKLADPCHADVLLDLANRD